MSFYKKIETNRHTVGFSVVATTKLSGSIAFFAAGSPTLGFTALTAAGASAVFAAVAYPHNPQKAGYDMAYQHQVPEDSPVRHLQ
jgi:multisubunit Na+/H+ antiporter MnhB subunit